MIDGFLTSEIGLHTLRQKMSIIPQVPFLNCYFLSCCVLAIETAYSTQWINLGLKRNILDIIIY